MAYLCRRLDFCFPTPEHVLLEPNVLIRRTPQPRMTGGVTQFAADE
jgi:hypothetical protein